MSDVPKTTPTLPAVLPEVEQQTRTRFEPRWYVILHDDQLHTYHYVIEMLCKLLTMSAKQALMHAIEVDTQGVTIVARLPKTEAESKRDQIMNYGGDPLMQTNVSMKASIEPVDD